MERELVESLWIARINVRVELAVGLIDSRVHQYVIRCDRAQARVLHCLGWTDVNSLLFEHPKHDQIDVNAIESADKRVMTAAKGCAGQIAAVARVSPTMCVCTTDTKLILEDTTREYPTFA